MGSGRNVALFKPEGAEVTNISYLRVKRVGYFAEPLSDFDNVHEEEPYDFAVAKT